MAGPALPDSIPIPEAIPVRYWPDENTCVLGYLDITNTAPEGAAPLYDIQFRAAPLHGEQPRYDLKFQPKEN